MGLGVGSPEFDAQMCGNDSQSLGDESVSNIFSILQDTDGITPGLGPVSFNAVSPPFHTVYLFTQVRKVLCCRFFVSPAMPVIILIIRFGPHFRVNDLDIGGHAPECFLIPVPALSPVR